LVGFFWRLTFLNVFYSLKKRRTGVTVKTERTGMFGKLDFHKLNLDIQSKLESDFDSLDVNKATDKDMTQIHEIYLASKNVIEKTESNKLQLRFNPIKSDIYLMFDWLGKKPSDYLIESVPLNEIDLQDLLDNLNLSFNDGIELTDVAEMDVQLEYLIDCYMSLKK
jgi:hypothetical protein